jgi:serine/threonine-protein phosphatase 5
VPTLIAGLTPNDNRGIGTMFGPNATKEFMTANGIALVLRSHEVGMYSCLIQWTHST